MFAILASVGLHLPFCFSVPVVGEHNAQKKETFRAVFLSIIYCLLHMATGGIVFLNHLRRLPVELRFTICFLIFLYNYLSRVESDRSLVVCGYVEPKGEERPALLTRCLGSSHFIPTCATCSTAYPQPGVVSVRGETSVAFCRGCHGRMSKCELH